MASSIAWNVLAAVAVPTLEDVGTVEEEEVVDDANAAAAAAAVVVLGVEVSAPDAALALEAPVDVLLPSTFS